MTSEQFYAMAVEMTEQGLGNIVRRDMVPDAVEQGMPEDMAVTLGVSAYNEVKDGQHMRGWLTPSQRDMLDETVDLALVGEEVAGTEGTTRIGGADYMAELIQPIHAGQRVQAWDTSTWNVVSDPNDYPVACHNGNVWDLAIDHDLDGTEEPLPTLADLGWEHDIDLAPGWES
jgi:hypothetical protein